MQHVELTDFFDVGEPAISYAKKSENDIEWYEVVVNGIRVGTGLTHESATQDTLINGKYALEKGMRRAAE